MATYEAFSVPVLPPDLESRVRSELDAGERLVWAAQPRPGRFALRTLPIVLFGIPWTAFAIFWMAGAGAASLWGSGAGYAPKAFRWGMLAFPLFGLPFVLVGFGMLGAPIWAWRKARQTCYALTDRRAIVFEPTWTRGVRITSYLPQELGSLSRVERADGSGDLVFRRTSTVDSDGDRRTREEGFQAIEAVRGVEERIRRTLLEPR